MTTTSAYWAGVVFCRGASGTCVRHRRRYV